MSIIRRALGKAYARAATIVVLSLGATTAAFGAEPSVAAISAVALLAYPAKPHSAMSVAVAHQGRITYENGFGFRDDGTPDRFIANDHNYYEISVKRAPALRAAADGRTIYAIGSVTRQFTATAILLLAQRHQISLDDPVGRYVAQFSDPGLTLRTLLNQRSGLPDLNTLSFLQRVRPLAKRHDGSVDGMLVDKEIAKLPRHFAAGARFEYSSSNYFVLGSVVERVSRQPLGMFLQANVFRPLRLTRTAYAKFAAAGDVALGYRVDEHSVVWRAYPWDLAWLGGAGAMTSTAGDLARWNIALMEHRVIGSASLAEMWRGLDAGRGQGSYAMGWIQDALGSHRYLWHNGEVGGFHAFNAIFPDDDLAISLLSNNQDARPEYLLPHLAALYFPVNGLDRILPRSAVVLIEASLAVGLGALAIAVVAIVTFKRFIVIGVVAALLALLLGFFLPTVAGYAWAGAAALVPVAAYVLSVRFIKRKVQPKS